MNDPYLTGPQRAMIMEQRTPVNAHEAWLSLGVFTGQRIYPPGPKHAFHATPYLYHECVPS